MHVLARLQGFGATVVPHAPYRIERVAEAPETTLRIWRSERSGLVDVRDVLRGSSSDLADVTQGDPALAWRIETSVFACAWPRGFGLTSDPDALSPFLLVGPSDAMIWTAGPIERARATPIERLVTADQTIRAVAQAGDNARIDVDYEHEGERWWQRRYALAWDDARVLVLTAQARAAQEAETCVAVDAIEDSITPTAHASREAE